MSDMDGLRERIANELDKRNFYYEDPRESAADAILSLLAPAIAQARAEAIEEAARVAEDEYPFDIDVWIKSTKKEMTAHTARAIATAIRALARVNEPADPFTRPADVSKDGADLHTMGGA